MTDKEKEQQIIEDAKKRHLTYDFRRKWNPVGGGLCPQTIISFEGGDPYMHDEIALYIQEYFIQLQKKVVSS